MSDLIVAKMCNAPLKLARGLHIFVETMLAFKAVRFMHMSRRLQSKRSD
jgi:hypothetical protein